VCELRGDQRLACPSAHNTAESKRLWRCVGKSTVFMPPVVPLIATTPQQQFGRVQNPPLSCVVKSLTYVRKPLCLGAANLSQYVSFGALPPEAFLLRLRPIQSSHPPEFSVDLNCLGLPFVAYQRWEQIKGTNSLTLHARQNGMADAREYLSTHITGESMIEVNSLAAHQQI